MSEDADKAEAQAENDQEAASGPEEETVTMVDVLQDERELEEDAEAVLGGADEKNCTYMTGGYVKRQPLYSCLTCIPAEWAKEDPGARCGGVCLACSYHCHEGCTLVELYTKRNFRCDCGNGRFPNNTCKLEKDKMARNEDNRYDQNFLGVYCTCSRPYPDPEDPVEDEMIQCVICEDWFHSRHLVEDGANVPRGDRYAEMICKGCVSKNDFVLRYPDFGWDYEPKKVDVENEEEVEKGKKCPLASVDGAEESAQVKAKSLFLLSGWREALCRCNDCQKLYQEKQVEFLLDPEDTVHFYESKNKQEGEEEVGEGEASTSSTSSYEKGMQALTSMERTAQVEAIHSYNQMKGDLMEYLAKFARNGKVVRQEDIAEFFEGMKANKRRKVEMPASFCR